MTAWEWQGVTSSTDLDEEWPACQPAAAFVWPTPNRQPAWRIASIVGLYQCCGQSTDARIMECSDPLQSVKYYSMS